MESNRYSSPISHHSATNCTDQCPLVCQAKTISALKIFWPSSRTSHVGSLPRYCNTCPICSLGLFVRTTWRSTLHIISVRESILELMSVSVLSVSVYNANALVHRSHPSLPLRSRSIPEQHLLTSHAPNHQPHRPIPFTPPLCQPQYPLQLTSYLDQHQFSLGPTQQLLSR